MRCHKPLANSISRPPLANQGTAPRPLAILLIATLIALCPSITTAQRLATSSASERIHWVPAGGLAHPLFESAGRDDAIEVYLTFGPPFHPGLDLAARLSQPLGEWRQSLAKKTDGKATIQQHGHRRTVRVALSGLEDPVAAVDKLVQTYRDAQLPLSEVFLLRRTIDAFGGRSAPLADPRSAEVKNYPDAESLWNATFDSKKVPPNSEDPSNELFMLAEAGGEALFEIRGTPIFFDDVRVAYGVPEVEVLEPDGRSLEVASSLRRRLLSNFPRGSAPAFIDTEGRSHRVIKLRNGDRLGYSFAVFRDSHKITPFVVRYPDGYRYREYELLSAVRETVLEMDLEPAIFWNRGSKYFFYVWERLPQPD